MKVNFTVNSQIRLTDALSQNVAGVTLSALKTLISNGEVKVNGVKATKNIDLAIGDSVHAFVPSKFISNQNVEIIYADANILIVLKPSLFDVENNLTSHIQIDHKTAQPVHRLDRNTSGLVVFSLNESAHGSLLAAFKHRTVDKRYIAKVCGKFTAFGRHTAYLFKDEIKGEVKISKEKKVGFKQIITEFSPLNHDSEQGTWIEARLITGRTHQIRAHLAFLGHPVIGDGRYGDKSGGSGYALHAYSIGFSELSAPLCYLNGKTFSISPKHFIE